MGLKIDIIIGANYGDEGKGLVTNQLTAGAGTLVALTNGGPQRGHTVLHSGKRHVFHHFGSGTLKGAASFFTGDFMVNPALFVKEANDLGFFPKCFASNNCRITTVYDMLGNSIRNLERQATDSTGCGILETIQRYKKNWSDLSAFAAKTKDERKVELLEIRNLYLRLYKNLVEDLAHPQHEQIKKLYELLLPDGLAESFLEDFDVFINHVKFAGIVDLAKSYSHIIFEQGQGLGLDVAADRTYGTPTATGSAIPFFYIGQLRAFHQVDSINRYYITRSYITRHGDGPLLDEDVSFATVNNIKDETNIPNQYQGAIRFAPLTQANCDSMCFRIAEDIALNSSDRFLVNNCLAITHYKAETSCEKLFLLANKLCINKIFLSASEETLFIKKI